MSINPVPELEAGRTELDREAFLRLLVTQLKHQDPLQPLDQSEFIAQLAQLQAVQESIETNKNIQRLLGLEEWTHTLGLLGRQVTARNPETGQPMDGRVEGVDLGAGPPRIIVNGFKLALEDILFVPA